MLRQSYDSDRPDLSTDKEASDVLPPAELPLMLMMVLLSRRRHVQPRVSTNRLGVFAVLIIRTCYNLHVPWPLPQQDFKSEPDWYLLVTL